MKNLYILFVLAFTFSAAYSQSPNIKWEKSLGGSGEEDAYSIQATSDGGYIVVGPSQSLDFQVTGHHGTATSYDYWVVKLDDTGGIQWENSFGGSGDDIVNSVQQTADGGYIVAGASESQDGDLSTCSIFEYDYWLLKLTSTGSIEWKNCFGGSGGSGFNKGYYVQETPDSSFIVTGFTNSTDTGEVTGFHGGLGDYWVIKVSSTGGFDWGKCLGGSGLDYANCIQFTTDGGYIVAGKSNSINGNVTGNHGSTDYWVVKLDDTGGIQWEKSYGGTAEDDGYSIRQTFDGGYIIAGDSYSINGQVTGHHGDTLSSDYWIVKIDDTGGIEWETSLGGSNNDGATSIQQTIDSGYVILGSSNSTDGNVTGNFGGNDYWVAKISKKGAFQWGKSLGGSGVDNGYAIQQTADSGYIVAGGSNSTDGDVTGNHGDDDFWVVKLSACQLISSPVIVKTGSILSTTLPYISYKWELNGVAIAGATNATYTIRANGNYTVFVTDTNSCAGLSAIPFTVVGVKNVYTNNNISIMPNPTTGLLKVTGAGLVKVAIYNELGQMIKEAENTDEISISEFPPNLYFIKLFDAGGALIYQDKIMKQ